MVINHFFPPLWLASKSPRRQELLQMAGFSFDVHLREVEEVYPENLTVNEVPAFLSQLKLEPFQSIENQWILTCDTLVILNGKILGKPTDESDAVEMLTKLSGKRHDVISGFSLFKNGKTWTFSEKTEVFFKQLPDNWIQWYVDNFKPLDKAGAYGVQECMGMMGIEKIIGDFYNVMGLPISRLSYEWQKILHDE